MARHGNSHGADFGSEVGSLVGGWLIVIAVIVVYILFRMSCYIVQTFVKYHNVAAKPLWYSLGVFVLLIVVNGVLSAVFNNQSGMALSGIGFVQLFLTCVVVQRHHAQTFMVEDVSIRDAILHRKWWADETTPIAA
jgi:hypothetical protein